MSNNDFREIMDENIIDEADAVVEDADKDVTAQEVILEDEKDDKGYEDICYICHRTERIAGKMIKIPGNVCICNDCMQRTFDQMNQGGFPNMMGFSMGMPPMDDIPVQEQPKSQRIKKPKNS